MNIKTVSNTKELPKFYLLFTSDTPPDTIQGHVWWDIEEIYLYESLYVPTYKFYAVPLPEVNTNEKDTINAREIRLGGRRRLRKSIAV